MVAPAETPAVAAIGTLELAPPEPPSFANFLPGRNGEAIDSIEGGDWHPSYGLGLRLSRPTALLGLAYLGFSAEGMTAGIRGSWPF